MYYILFCVIADCNTNCRDNDMVTFCLSFSAHTKTRWSHSNLVEKCCKLFSTNSDFANRYRGNEYPEIWVVKVNDKQTKNLIWQYVMHLPIVLNGDVLIFIKLVANILLLWALHLPITCLRLHAIRNLHGIKSKIIYFNKCV